MMMKRSGSNHIKPLGREMVYFYNGGNIIKPWLVKHIFLLIVVHCMVWFKYLNYDAVSPMVAWP
jgi:hypothetical protein